MRYTALMSSSSAQAASYLGGLGGGNCDEGGGGAGQREGVGSAQVVVCTRIRVVFLLQLSLHCGHVIGCAFVKSHTSHIARHTSHVTRQSQYITSFKAQLPPAPLPPPSLPALPNAALVLDSSSSRSLICSTRVTRHNQADVRLNHRQHKTHFLLGGASSVRVFVPLVHQLHHALHAPPAAAHRGSHTWAMSLRAR